MKTFKSKILVALLGMSSLSIAQAATTTSTFQVTTTVTASCSVTATNMAFAAFNQQGANVNATSTITPICTKGTPYTVSIDAGLNGGGTARKMKHSVTATELLTYTLTKDDGTTAIPFTGTAYTSLVGDGYGGADQTITLKGQVVANQRVIAGSYSDTITATITY